MATVNSNELVHKRNNNLKLMEDMVKTAKESGLKPDKEQWDRYLNEDEALVTQIRDAQLEEKRAAIEAGNAYESQNNNGESEEKKRYSDAFYKYITKGKFDLNAEERNILTRGTGNQTTTVGEGGYSIAEGFSNQLFVNRALWGGMFDVATILNTAKGNKIPWPKVDDTGQSGGLVSEASTIAVADITYTEAELDAYKYTSYIVKVSPELLQDSAFNMEEHLLRDIFPRRIGSAENAHFTTGSGTGQPNGVVTAASSGVTAAATNTVTAAELVQLIHAVDPVWRKGSKVGWMLNDSTLSTIRQVSIAEAASNNGPLWTPGRTPMENDKIYGYDVFINQDVADLDNSSKSILFGDFSQYVIRVVNGSQTVRRLEDTYAVTDLIGFVGFERADGELIATNAIKFITQAST